MISVFNYKEDCCGCTACKSICPTQSITMRPDEEGFLYPEIDQKLCIDCGLCIKVCPLQNEVNVSERFKQPLVYALKHKSNKVRMTSASGGAYSAISDYALNSSCTIYGSEFSETFNVQHKGTTNEAGREKFKGSKYIQSELGDVFRQILQNLENERGVLFTGTACQVAGLRKYLEKTKISTDKLILNDIICHGVTSPLIWKGYLRFIQQKSKLKTYTFRYKEKGWRGYNVKAEFENGKSKINTPDIKAYVNIFTSDLALRPSCYHCKFSNLCRPSDIMIGDFWGIEKTLPDLSDTKGVSLVFVNTPKGKDIFDKIKGGTYFIQSNTKDCLQHNLQQPTKMPTNRERFWIDYYKFGFEYIAKKYGGYSIKGKLKRFAISSLKKVGLFELARKALGRR